MHLILILYFQSLDIHFVMVRAQALKTQGCEFESGLCRASLSNYSDCVSLHSFDLPFPSSNIQYSRAYGVFIADSYGMTGLAPLVNVLF